jgi:hypothetical protein
MTGNRCRSTSLAVTGRDLDHRGMKRCLLLVVALTVSACGHSGYSGPVAVHATVELQSSSSTSGGTCHGTGNLAEYRAGHRLVVVDQDSQAVSNAVLPEGVRRSGGCDFQITVTLPRGERSLWLPMSELGIACPSSRRGAALFDRSTISAHAVNASLALPGAAKATGRCT